MCTCGIVDYSFIVKERSSEVDHRFLFIMTEERSLCLLCFYLYLKYFAVTKCFSAESS